MKMKYIDFLFLTSIWIPFPVISFFLLFWWGGYFLNYRAQLPGIAISGLIIGSIVCALTISNWLRRTYTQKTWLLICLYLFYMIGIFGFFMGVPVFNIIPGVLAAIYLSRKTIVHNLKSSDYNKLLNKLQIFMAAGLLLVCIFSAFLALSDQSTGANIKGMLGLPFTVTTGMIWGIIVIGGAALLAAQYLIIKVTGILTIKVLKGAKSQRYYQG
jgi:hypothetical protein